MAQLDPKKNYGPSPSDLTRPGVFKNVSKSVHTRAIPPGQDSKGNHVPETVDHVQPGGTFHATGGEAQACRADGGNKFIEITPTE